MANPEDTGELCGRFLQSAFCLLAVASRGSLPRTFAAVPAVAFLCEQVLFTQVMARVSSKLLSLLRQRSLPEADLYAAVRSIRLQHALRSCRMVQEACWYSAVSFIPRRSGLQLLGAGA